MKAVEIIPVPLNGISGSDPFVKKDEDGGYFADSYGNVFHNHADWNSASNYGMAGSYLKTTDLRVVYEGMVMYADKHGKGRLFATIPVINDLKKAGFPVNVRINSPIPEEAMRALGLVPLNTDQG